jgi:predicted membrane chloride channel (bestrophin family)
MIGYSKQWWGVGEVFVMYGSALPRSAPVALLSAGIAALARGLVGESIKRHFKDNYPFQAFAIVLGFLLVFRCRPFLSPPWAALCVD